jgi:hypothetical protein
VKGKGHVPWMVWSYAGDFSACLIPICAGYFTESCYLLSKNIVLIRNTTRCSQMSDTESCSKPVESRAHARMFSLLVNVSISFFHPDVNL